jgi:hypothetical protein
MAAVGGQTIFPETYLLGGCENTLK